MSADSLLEIRPSLGSENDSFALEDTQTCESQASLLASEV